MRPLLRAVTLLLALALTGLAVPSAPAQAASEACNRYNALKFSPNPSLGINVDGDVVNAAERQCYSQSDAADQIPLRDLGDTFSFRPGDPCSDAGETAEATCIAEWVEYVRFFESHPKDCYDRFWSTSNPTSITCATPPGAAAPEEEEGTRWYLIPAVLLLGALIAVVAFVIWLFGGGPLSDEYMKNR